jgi:hypothetical protein
MIKMMFNVVWEEKNLRMFALEMLCWGVFEASAKTANANLANLGKRTDNQTTRPRMAVAMRR